MFAGHVPQGRTSEILLSDFFETYNRRRKSEVGAMSFYNWKFPQAKMLKCWGNVKLSSLTPLHGVELREFMEAPVDGVKGVTGRTRRPDTVNGQLTITKTMFKHAIRWGYLTESPVADLRIKKSTPAVMRIFSDAESDAMEDAVVTVFHNKGGRPTWGMSNEWLAQWWVTAIRVLRHTGLRREELMRLRWQDIDMKAGEVSVSSYPDARFRAADGEVKIYAWKPKTEAGVRSIPIPKEDVALIGRWRMRTDDSPYVFTPKPRLRVLEAAAAKGERVYFVPPGRPDHSLDRIQEVAAESLGIAFCPSGVIGDGWIRGTMKDFRKTFATHCVARNVKPKELQKYMGHEDIKITMDFYTAVAEDAKERLLGIWPKAQSSIA